MLDIFWDGGGDNTSHFHCFPDSLRRFPDSWSEKWSMLSAFTGEELGIHSMDSIGTNSRELETVVYFVL